MAAPYSQSDALNKKGNKSPLLTEKKIHSKKKILKTICYQLVASNNNMLDQDVILKV